MKNELIDDLMSLRWNKRYRIWKPFMEKYKCEVICEVGVRTGENFCKMIKHNPRLAVAVDIWKEDGTRSRNDVATSQDGLDKQYEKFRKMVGDKSFVHIFREYSFDAVKRFPNEYFDLVYIDADHTYEGCYKDIIDWYPKVKKGGLLLGDDYVNHKTRTGVQFGVIEAVNKFVTDNNLSFFFFPRKKWGIIRI